jgi:hypothetical protein
LIEDLELDILFDAMAGGDAFLREVAANAVLASLHDPAVILYRQQVLEDCFAFPSTAKEIYAAAIEGVESEKKVWSLRWDRDPVSALHRACEVLRFCVTPLRRLQQIATKDGPGFQSEGFQRFFAMIAAELDEGYIRTVEEYLERLEFADGVLMSGGISSSGKGSSYILRKTATVKRTWFERMQHWVTELTNRPDPAFVYEVDERDEAGYRTLGDLRTQGMLDVSTALTQSADHILSFFRAMRLELAFYIGCLNLSERLRQKREPVCYPEPLQVSGSEFRCKGLYDICLSLSIPERVVGNGVAADSKPLAMITGANRGGKSTFLRSVGLAFLMMHCGMFVPAQSFRAELCSGLFTHFKREEDATMKSGKLDEELSRMRAIVETITPGGIVLMNESFASTNEREGSEIAAQIVRALLQTGVRVFFVTHMFALAEMFHRDQTTAALFLRAERLADGRRTFRLLEGEPLPTSFGEDLYRRIFEGAA